MFVLENEVNTTIECLPNEILLDVFNYLDGHDLLNCYSVCKTWRTVASDGFLWQRKLCELFGRRWSIVICEKKPENPLDLSDLNVLHASKVYWFVSRYIPKHLLPQQHNYTSVHDQKTDLYNCECYVQPTLHRSLGRMLKRCWSQMVNRMSMAGLRRNGRITVPPYRFAVFGPGFDQRATSRLFSKLVDTRTKSFEPISLIPGRMGFGAGLTLRLYAQAQAAVSDPSIGRSVGTSTQPCERIPANSQQTGNGHTAVNFHLTTNRATTLQIQDSGSVNSISADIHEDLIFDLHYLYSLRGNLTSTFSNQLERIMRSRFFQHPSTENGVTDSEILSSLSVTESMQNVLKGVNGIIYALDARESVEQSKYLFYELHGILRSFPETLAKLIPIAILYIMPKEEIMLRPTVTRNSSNHSLGTVMLNRDSYSGVDYTVSWQGSLLLPISCLRLFELENPWRLQKCASNDIKAVIQSIMWLRERAPKIPLEQMHQLTLANSTW